MSEGGAQVVDFLGYGDFVEVGANYLWLADDAPAEVVSGLFARLKYLAGGVQWMVGDFFVGVQRLRGDELASRLMSEWDVSYGSAARARHVCAALPREVRVAGLSFGHHEQALQMCADVRGALELLARAAADGLSIAKMRRLVVDSAGSAVAAGSARAAQVLSGLGEVYRAAAVIERLSVARLSASDRATLKRDLEPFVKFYNQL